MRDLIDIVSEDSSAGNLLQPTTKHRFGEKPTPDDSEEGKALAALKDAFSNYKNVLQASSKPSAPHHLRMLKKMFEILQWMGR